MITDVNAYRTIFLLPSVGGHRTYYASLLIGELGGGEVWTVSASRNSQELKSLEASEVGGAVGARFFKTRARLYAHVVLLLSCRSERVRLIVLDGDGLLLPAAILSGLPMRKNKSITLLLMRPGFGVRFEVVKSRVLIKRGLWLICRKLGGRKGIRVFGLSDAFGVLTPANRQALWVRDPVRATSFPSREEARARLYLPARSFIVGLIGAIDHRKNLDLILDALRATPNAHILIAGRIYDCRDRSALQSYSNEARAITHLDGYITESELTDAIAASDVVVAMYDNHYSPSGILAHSILARVPVVVPEGGALALIVKEFPGVGSTSSFASDALAAALSRYASSNDRVFISDNEYARAHKCLGSEDFIQKMAAGTVVCEA